MSKKTGTEWGGEETPVTPAGSNRGFLIPAVQLTHNLTSTSHARITEDGQQDFYQSVGPVLGFLLHWFRSRQFLTSVRGNAEPISAVFFSKVETHLAHSSSLYLPICQFCTWKLPHGVLFEGSSSLCVQPHRQLEDRHLGALGNTDMILVSHSLHRTGSLQALIWYSAYLHYRSFGFISIE